jgi:hypothetical protein
MNDGDDGEVVGVPTQDQPRPQASVASPLNGPLEVGIRVLMVLTEAFPSELDLNQLVLLDHFVLHSGDVGGPESLHPALPIRAGEIAVKRETIEAGIGLLLRLHLVEFAAERDGLRFHAGESALHFVGVLGSSYSRSLRDRVEWVLGNFPDLNEASLRQHTKAVFDSWSEEFHWPDGSAMKGTHGESN